MSHSLTWRQKQSKRLLPASTSRQAKTTLHPIQSHRATAQLRAGVAPSPTSNVMFQTAKSRARNLPLKVMHAHPRARECTHIRAHADGQTDAHTYIHTRSHGRTRAHAHTRYDARARTQILNGGPVSFGTRKTASLMSTSPADNLSCRIGLMLVLTALLLQRMQMPRLPRASIYASEHRASARSGMQGSPLK